MIMYKQVKVQLQNKFSNLLKWIIFCKAKDVKEETGEMDRISELPDFIVHHILSFVNTPTVLVRMSALSKKWFHLTASFPILEFSAHGFRYRESFFKYVEYTTSRFHRQNLTAQKFRFAEFLWEPAEVDVINRCLELVLKNGVRELVICIDNLEQCPPLPNILLQVSVLRYLTISNCQLPSSLMVDAVNLKSLIQLTLYFVPIDDKVINHLTTSCPLLQVLNISFCRGFKIFCVHGHQNLKKIDICWNPQVKRIDIVAPQLYDLSIRNGNKREAPTMNFASCKKLTTVYYSGDPLLNDFLSNFPFIENLHLNTKCNNFKWSSHSLRTLVLESVCDLESIEFTIPNLVLFIFPGEFSWRVKNKCWPMLKDLTHIKGCMHFHPFPSIDTLWFPKLRRFLDMKNGFKVLNLYIDSSYRQKSKELEKLKGIELPCYELEHVELQLDTRQESSAHIAFVDAVLWCCRPRSLTLRSFSYSPDPKVVEFTYNRLAEQEDQGHTKVQIMGPFFTEAQKHIRDLKSASVALPPERNTILLLKE